MLDVRAQDVARDSARNDGARRASDRDARDDTLRGLRHHFASTPNSTFTQRRSRSFLLSLSGFPKEAFVVWRNGARVARRRRGGQAR